MFKKTFIPFILILSLSVYGQKKELKAVVKLVESQDYDTALNQLLSLQPVVQDSELKYQAQYQFLAGKIAKKILKPLLLLLILLDNSKPKTDLLNTRLRSTN